MAASTKRGIKSVCTIEANLISLDTVGSYRLVKLRDIVQRILHRTLANGTHEQEESAIDQEGSQNI